MDRAERDGLAIEEDFAGVGGLHAGEDFHQRALARTVLAVDREHLAALDGEAHALERPHAREGLGQRAGFEQGHRNGEFGMANSESGYVRSGADGRRFPIRNSPFAIYFPPTFAFRSAQNSSTLSLRICRAGMSMNLLAGTTLLLPLRISFSTSTDL